MKIRNVLASCALCALSAVRRQRPGGGAKRIHGGRHPRRGAAAHLRRHGLQLPAGQHRRSRSTPSASRRRCARCTSTGFFRDVELRRDGNTLVVVVLERPSIESFEIKGNKDIKTEDLQKSLRNVGLASGKTFDRSVLEEVTQYLTDQYFSRGKYAVRVDTNVEELPGNKVRISDRRHGGQARARSARSTSSATRVFDDEDLREDFELNTPELALVVPAGRSLRARIAAGRPGEAALVLHGSRLRELPDRVRAGRHRPGKDDIFITVNIHEGEVFKVERGQARRQHGGAGSRSSSGCCWSSRDKPSTTSW